MVAEPVLLRHQLLVLERPRQRAPDLQPVDRFIAGLCTGLMRPARLLRSAIVLKPATTLNFHRLLVKRKYRELFAPKRKPGKAVPKGPSRELVAAIAETKRRNPRFGYQRIADQIALAFNIPIDKDTVRRVLIKHYRPNSGPGGQSGPSDANTSIMSHTGTLGIYRESCFVSKITSTVSVRIRASAAVFLVLNPITQPEMSLPFMTIAGNRAAATCISFRLWRDYEFAPHRIRTCDPCLRRVEVIGNQRGRARSINAATSTLSGNVP